MLLLVLVVNFFVSAFGIKVIEREFPHAATHVREAKAVSSLFAIVIHRRETREAVAPRSIRQGPDGVSAGKKVDGRDRVHLSHRRSYDKRPSSFRRW